MRDQTFGELNYEFGWNGTVLLDCFGKKETVDFIVYGEDTARKNLTLPITSASALRPFWKRGMEFRTRS